MEAGQKTEEGSKKQEVTEVVEQETVTEILKGPKKTQSKWEKAKGILTDKQIGNQAAKTTVETVASIAGVKSLYDVPAYLYQRFKVGGIFGQGKGLTGSVEELITKSEDGTGSGERYALWGEVNKLENDTTLSADKKEDKLAELNRKLTETEPTKVRDAIENLNTRLALTKEGEQKHSDQRKLIAKVLWERRTKEKMSMDDVRGKMDSILDEYTTTKVSGMQAVRESLNTALVASGALSLRGVSYAALDAVERKQRLDKEAKNQGLSLEEKYQRLGDKNAKSVGKEATWWKDVFVGSIRETYHEAFAQGQEGKTVAQKAVNVIKAWGKIARYAGMGSTVSFRPEAFGGDMDNVLEVLSGQASLGDVAENFQGNIERTIDGYKNIANKLNPVSSESSGVGDKSAGGEKATVEYQEGKRFPIGERPNEIHVPASEKLGGLSEAAIVQKGEGIEHAFIRQLSDEPEKFGFTGDSKNDDAVSEWAGRQAHNLAIKAGYVDLETGSEIRVGGKGGAVAYGLEKDSSGNFKVNEYLKDAEGNFVGKEINEVAKDLDGAQFETDRESYEYEGAPAEQASIPANAESPASEWATPEQSDATAEYQLPVQEIPSSTTGLANLERSEVYAGRIEEGSTEKYTYNMPSVDPEQMSAAATRLVGNDVDKLFGTKGVLGFGGTKGTASPDWADTKVGFGNGEAKSILDQDLGKFKGQENLGIGTENSGAVEKMQNHLNAVIEKTGVQPKPGEKTGDFLTRALMGKINEGIVIPGQSSGAMDTEYQNLEDRLVATGGQTISEQQEVYEERIEPTVKHAINMPSVDHEQMLAIKTQQINNDIDKMFGSKGLIGLGSESGADSLDWKDQRVGFANKTVEEVMGTTSGKPRLSNYGRIVRMNSGIENSAATKKIQEYLTNIFKETDAKPEKGEKVADYLKRVATLTSGLK